MNNVSTDRNSNQSASICFVKQSSICFVKTNDARQRPSVALDLSDLTASFRA
jgi:hypothetical protein